MSAVSKITLSVPLNNFFWLPIIITTTRFIPILADFSFIFLSFYCFFGTKQAIQGLFLSWFFTMANSTIAPTIEMQNLLRYLVIFSAFFSIFFRCNFLKFDTVYFYTISFCFFIFLHSIFFSQIFSISLLKLISWSIVIVTLIKAWSNLDHNDYEKTLNWIVNFLIIILFLSLPLLFIPNIGYEKTQFGFQGLLNHPQTFGPTYALLSAYLIGELITQKKPKYFLFIMIIICFFIILLSGSRTAGLALFLAFSISMILFLLKNIFSSRSYTPALQSYRLFFSLYFFIFIFFIFWQDALLLINSFINKGNNNRIESIFEVYQISRGILYEPMIINIKNNFLSGIGFGIASNPLLANIELDPFFNLPISASNEKGIVPLMVFEELGFFGFTIFLCWIFLLLRISTRNFKSFLIFNTIILLNLGEAVLFSVGGLGMLILIFFITTIVRRKF